jgi:competence protein ComEA
MLRTILAAILTFSPAAVAQGRLPAGAGRDALLKDCSTCHSPENVAGMAKTRDDWSALVGQMVDQGAQGTEDEFNRIVDYLATNFPDKINVNKAAAPLFETVLDLSGKEAQAVIQYREQKGGFRSIDDLEKVPGVDTKKFETRKDRIVY